MTALNWYSLNKTRDDSASWFIKRFPDVSKEAIHVISNMGYVVRMIDRGMPTDSALNARIEKRYNEALRYTKNIPKVVEKEKPVDVVCGISVNRDEMLDNIIGDINCAMDDIITTGKADVPKIIDVLKTSQRKQIIEFCKKALKSIENEMTQDECGYSIREGNALIKMLTTMLGGLDASSPAKKARKAKAYTPEKLMKGFTAKFEEGIKPVKLIGAKAALVYDTERRLLSLFEGAGDSGLSVKTTSITGYAATSVRKTLRKPDEVLPTLKGLTYRNTMLLLKAIRATEQSVIPRLTANHTILAIW
jgi:hypothetical protein